MSWRKLWLLFTVIWVVVTGLQAMTILIVGEEPEKVSRPLVLMIAVPPLLYVIGLAWQWLTRKRPSGS